MTPRRAQRAGTALERVAIGVASLIVSVGLIALLSGFFASRDQAGVTGAITRGGLEFRDLGRAHLTPGAPRPPYDSAPPTSGAHVPEPVRRNASPLSDDQLLQALETGNVVFIYGTGSPPSGLRSLAGSLAGPFTPALVAAGQAVILARRSGTRGIIALAWTHMVRVNSAADPALRDFTQMLLGRGAPGR